MASAFKRLTPLFNRILVKKLEVSTKTSSGIILSEASDKTSVGVVIETGPGQFDSTGKIQPLSVKVGDTVLLPDYGGSKVKLANEAEYYLFRDTDILGVLHK